MPDNSYQPKVYRRQGGDTYVVASGGELLVEDGGELILPAQSGNGIRVGDTDAATFPFRSIDLNIESRGVGVNDPAWSQISATAFFGYKFTLDDHVWFALSMPHDYVAGTNITMGVDWLPDGTNANSVKWQIEHAYAKSHNQAAYDLASPTTITMEQVVGGTQYQNYNTESAEQTITGLEPDGMLFIHLTRITNGGTDNTDEIFVIHTEVTYQSTGIGTKNSSPDFYT